MQFHQQDESLLPALQWQVTLANLIATIRANAANLEQFPSHDGVRSHFESDLQALERHALALSLPALGSLEGELLRNDVELQQNMRVGIEQQIGVAARTHRMVEVTDKHSGRHREPGVIARLLGRRCTRCDQQEVATLLVERTLNLTRLAAKYVMFRHTREQALEMRQEILDAADLADGERYDTGYSVSAVWNVGVFRWLVQEANRIDLEIETRHHNKAAETESPQG